MVLTGEQLWLLVLERLANAKQISQTHLEWLRQSHLVPTQTAHMFFLQMANTAHQLQIERRCKLYIENALFEATGGKIAPKLSIVVTKQERRATPRAREGAAPLFADESIPQVATAIPEAEATMAKAARAARQTPEQRRRNRDVQMRQFTSPARHPEIAVPATSTRPPTIIHTARTEPPPILEKPAWLNDRYTFDTYIVGKTNHFAWAACQGVADGPGTAYNPLFLYGGVGLGKTHLLHAIAHAVAPRGLRTLYVTSETFTNEIINAIRYRMTEEFRAKYRSVDILLVDDIQFIAGKDSTEEEFFHTFNALHENGKQIVICSDRPPKGIELEERLRSRFEWGLIADIQPPDLETRLAILSAKAEALGVVIPDSCLTFLADRVQSNVRELEGLLNRVISFSKLYKTPLTVDIVKQAVASLAQADKPRRRISIIEIAAAIVKHYQVPMDDLRGKHRDKHIVTPRQVAMWLMRQETEASLHEIGQLLGGRDHSTVLHGCDKIDAELKHDNQQLMHEIAAIRQILAEQQVS